MLLVRQNLWLKPMGKSLELKNYSVRENNQKYSVEKLISVQILAMRELKGQ